MQPLHTITYSESGSVATVVLNRPQAGNRINIRMLKELGVVCDHLEDHSEAKVVVFRGAGDTFSLGVDFQDFHPDHPMDIHGFNRWEKMVVRLERLPKVTVALVDGPAVGGGMQLALVMDQRLATSRSTFQLPEVHMGFLPGMATFRLAKYIGIGRARRLMLCAEVLSAQGALDMGLIDCVSDDLDDALQRTIASFGPIHTVSVALCRRLLNESFSRDWEEAIGNFLAAQHRAVNKSAFLETLKREREG